MTKPIPGTPPTNERQKLVMVTGPSGAGRSTAIAALEDIGFEAIDNLPLSLIPRLLSGAPLAHPLALGVDARNRDFSPGKALTMIDALSARPDLDVTLLYLDCAPEVLLRRFSETRRRHPLAPTGSPEQGIEAERQLIEPLKPRSNLLIDTSDLTPHQLRDELRARLLRTGSTGLVVSVQSFSYKHGAPPGLDLMFDVRFLRNPHWEPALRHATGREAAVAAHIAADPMLDVFESRMNDLLLSLLPAYQKEGKAYLSIGIGCTGGQHRSVFVSERLATTLADAGWQVSIRHRELSRHAAFDAGRSDRGDRA